MLRTVKHRYKDATEIPTSKVLNTKEQVKLKSLTSIEYSKAVEPELFTPSWQYGSYHS
jgi:hypothetical protein